MDRSNLKCLPEFFHRSLSSCNILLMRGLTSDQKCEKLRFSRPPLGEQTEPKVSENPETCRSDLPFSVWSSPSTQRRWCRRRWRPNRSPAGCWGVGDQLGDWKLCLFQWGLTSYWTGPALFLPAVHAGP